MDPERLRIEIAKDGGADLSIEGPCAGGRYGAHYVRWPDGTRGVLSWQPEIPVAQVEQAGVVLAALDDRGYPVPAYEMAKEFEGGVILVQSRLPGKPPTGIDQSLLKGILAVNELQHHALSDRAEVRGIPLYLTEDGPGYCLHESLQRHPRSARLARWIGEVATAMPAYLPGTDAVHGDFHPTNFLVADSRITGVVDWTGVGSGDRHFDLVTLRFSLHGRRMDGQVVAALDEYLEQAPPDTVRAAWAHMSLRMVDWATRFYSPEDVENWLDLVETRSG